MTVRQPLTNLITTSIAKAQLLAIDEATTTLDLPRGTVARVLATAVFADPTLRDWITGAGRGEVARAALIVAGAEIHRFHDVLHGEAQARAAAKARSQQQLIHRLSRMNQTNEVQA
ncbi:TPA: hypothetical protein QDB07_000852 [Burkholderia vietnamiensis]|nr:hypothetical protein [Burkholderia vietnamiensis]